MSIKNKPYILIADDTLENIQVLGLILKKENYHVTVAQNGLQALKAVQTVKPDLILLDIMMPELDGFETCKRLKASPLTEDIPVIFLTARVETEDVVKGFGVGAIDYVTKPFNPVELLARVNTQLQLSKTQQQLKEAHSHMVQTEKMASLGTLVAGVAHEINNPVNFVTMSMESLEDEVAEHKAFLNDLLEEEPKLMKLLGQHFDKFQIRLDDIKEGSQRIRNIVNDLRMFSRLDEAEHKTIVVSSGLTSTVRLVKAKYKDTIKFFLNFKDDPEVPCWPSQLNQVFMNITVNACHAILARQTQETKPSPGKLVIETFIQDGELGIRFKDNGVGMTEDVKKRIFEPFYTTKTVGEGTGMGMAISYGIIEKHKGHLEVNSTVGKGTQITVFLPLDTEIN